MLAKVIQTLQKEEANQELRAQLVEQVHQSLVILRAVVLVDHRAKQLLILIS